LPIGQFLVSDVGPDHFLVPTNGREKVTARPEFLARKLPHLAFDILRDPYRTDELRHRIFAGLQHITVIQPRSRVDFIPVAVKLPGFAPP
jgi:hypothetical protein